MTNRLECRGEAEVRRGSLRTDQHFRDLDPAPRETKRFAA